MDTPLQIDVWSDYVCPFCYLELPALQRVQQEWGAQVQIRWRAFELRPEPAPTLDPNGDYLHDIWQRSIYPMAVQRGIKLQLPPVQPRSRKALEAAAHARSAGRFDAMHEALFRAFFEEGRDIGRTDILVDIGASVGLEQEPLQQALAQGLHTAEVLADHEQALNLGITGVPLMLARGSDSPLQHAIGLAGAVPFERIEATLKSLARTSS